MPSRKWFTHDFGWKMFSLFLAIVIWLTIHKIREEPNLPAEVAGDTLSYDNLPVLVVSSASDVRNFRVAPNTVSVKVSGSTEAISILQANQIHAVVDLTDIQGGHNLRRHVDISTPPGITLLSVEPAEVGVIIPPVNDKK